MDIAINILNKRFHSNSFERSFKIKLDYVLTNLLKHRNSNFYGALLSHHSMKSSMYMSKWIEEKNKKSF